PRDEPKRTGTLGPDALVVRRSHSARARGEGCDEGSLTGCAHYQTKEHVIKVTEECAGSPGSLRSLAGDEREGAGSFRPDAGVVRRNNAAGSLDQVGAKRDVTGVVDADHRI